MTTSRTRPAILHTRPSESLREPQDQSEVEIMAQLVGQKCVHCEGRISDELESRFCEKCGSAVHDRCIRTSESVGCSGCGARLPPPVSVSTEGGSVRPKFPLRTRAFFVAFYSMAVVWGVRYVSPQKESSLDLICSLVMALALGMWAIADARHRRHSIPLLARPWFVLFAGLVVPAYLLWTRGWRGAAWVVVNSVCWYGVATVSMYLSWSLIYGR